MLNLFIDTSYKYLTVVVSDDKNIIASYSSECFKRQSEELFMILDNLFKELAKKLSEEDEKVESEPKQGEKSAPEFKPEEPTGKSAFANFLNDFLKF